MEQLAPISIYFARLLILCLFVVNAVFICLLWHKRRRDVNISWELKFIMAKFSIVNLLGQLAGCLMILLRWDVGVGCAIMFCCVCLQV